MIARPAPQRRAGRRRLSAGGARRRSHHSGRRCGAPRSPGAASRASSRRAPSRCLPSQAAPLRPGLTCAWTARGPQTLRNGFETIRGARAVLFMIRGFNKGVVKLGLLTCTKPE